MDTTQRFLASRNHNLTYNLGAKLPRWQNRKFQHYTVYAKVGQLRVNNNQVISHLSMKLSHRFDQNPPSTFDKNKGKPKMLTWLGLESKGQGHSKNKKTMAQGAINMPSTKKMSRDSPNYWCLTDLSNML